jgi:hypothetical protein
MGYVLHVAGIPDVFPPRTPWRLRPVVRMLFFFFQNPAVILRKAPGSLMGRGTKVFQSTASPPF